MKDCLVLVDVQNDYFPDGAMELSGMEEAAAKGAALLREFRRRGWPVIHVAHIALQPGATFFLPGTKGAEINPAVSPVKDERVVTKHFPNSFRETALLDLLRDEEPDRLVICGAMSHMCIDATARAAFDLGFACIVAEDACATRDLVFNGRTVKAADVHASFMAALSAPYARVASTGEVLKDMSTSP